ncbi:hypothetical protein N234_18225 [Ralstonia pickettii DTP0602]|nr:hypothetical protein N234_18225 [Ralstonia pickettii DTP0602]
MPDSCDINEHQHKGKSNSRLEFSAATRKHLAAAAGYKCAIRSCLIPSTCSATKRGGTVGSANLGKASHIFAASPNGPRPAPPGMTPAQIMDHSNGIWTCSRCADTVDKLECDYSSEQLSEMKRVREAAAKMEASDPEISVLSRYIPPIMFDEVFWNHLPTLDVNEIRPALREIAGKSISALDMRTARDISAPSHLSLKLLAGAIKTIIDGNDDGPVAVPIIPAIHPRLHNRPSADATFTARRRAAEIVGAWFERTPSRRRRNGTSWLIQYVGVLISARDPQTGDECESQIRAIADGYGRHDHTCDDGEILRLKVAHTDRRGSNLSWRLDEVFDNGTMHSTSTLRLAGKLSPRNFNSAQWGDELDAYEQVVRKLREGWQPIGFVDMSPKDSMYQEHMHPEEFSIDLKITQSELDDSLYRSSKIRLARKLEKEWGRIFTFNDVYFEYDLSPAMIQDASDKLRDRLGPPPYWHRGESPPLVRVGMSEITFVAWDSKIFFKSMPRRGDPSSPR